MMDPNAKPLLRWVLPVFGSEESFLCRVCSWSLVWQRYRTDARYETRREPL